MKKVMTSGMVISSMLLMSGCAGMGGGPVGGAIGHMLFGAVVALAAVFGYNKLKK